MKVGQRVVRGPDWPSNNISDGGDGSVGTVVYVGKTSAIVLVLWDNGELCDYSAGQDGLYHLRVLDSAPIGTKHEGIDCEYCKEKPILGMCWKCVYCVTAYLCTLCYMANRHSTEHPFRRVDHPEEDGVEVGHRLGSRRMQSMGIFAEARVVRGRDWNRDNEDGGERMEGSVGTRKDLKLLPPGRVLVQWDRGKRAVYRLGAEGKVDLKCVWPRLGPLYYIDHLPKLGELPLGNMRQETKPPVFNRLTSEDAALENSSEDEDAENINKEGAKSLMSSKRGDDNECIERIAETELPIPSVDLVDTGWAILAALIEDQRQHLPIMKNNKEGAKSLMSSKRGDNKECIEMIAETEQPISSVDELDTGGAILPAHFQIQQLVDNSKVSEGSNKATSSSLPELNSFVDGLIEKTSSEKLQAIKDHAINLFNYVQGPSSQTLQQERNSNAPSCGPSTSNMNELSTDADSQMDSRSKMESDSATESGVLSRGRFRGLRQRGSTMVYEAETSETSAPLQRQNETDDLIRQGPFHLHFHHTCQTFHTTQQGEVCVAGEGTTLNKATPSIGERASREALGAAPHNRTTKSETVSSE